MRNWKMFIPQMVLSGVFAVGYFITLWALMASREVQFSDQVFGVLTTVIGVLTAAIPTIIHFWLGSSTGSKEKDTKQEPEQRG